MKKIWLTALFFALAGFAAGAYVFHAGPGQAPEQKEDRKILFYRNPMNPEMTSPIPKKASDGMDYVPVYEEKAAEKSQKKIAYYKDPMHPWYTSDKPGKAPDCGMDLVPVYEGEQEANGIRIDPVTVQNIGVKTEDISRKMLTKTIRTSGVVEIDETKLYTITPKFMGWVETLNVDETGQTVKKNQPLLTIYSPDLVSAQEEYIMALNYQKKMQDSTIDEVRGQGKDMVKSVARRLKNWDVPEHEIVALAKRGKPERTVKMVAPAGGVVLEKMVTSGQKVEAGMPLYKIADLSKVWITADIFQSDLSWIKTGQTVDVEPSYLPGKTFRGKLVFIYPTMNTETRTAKVRIELANTPDYALKPGMFASVSIRSNVAIHSIAVPEQAVIRSGTRNVAVVALGGGYFEPRDIQTGVTADGFIQVLEGLHEGEKLVTSAQFLIDSESNLKAAVSSMGKPPGKDQPSMDMGAMDKAENKDPKTPIAMETNQPEKDKDATRPNPVKPDAIVPVPVKKLKGTSGLHSGHPSTVMKAEKPLIKNDTIAYTCEMHPEIHSDKPGNCPICGMTLVPVKKPARKKETQVQYTCEMHPEVISDKPGNCPICGMTLIPKK